MPVLYAITGALLLLSLFSSRQKTVQALRMGLRMFLNLLPTILGILVVVSLLLALAGPDTIRTWLGERSGPLAYLLAALAGAVALMPGFVALPMTKMLTAQGVSWGVAAVFITSLLMVGVVTIPMEKKFFGLKVAIARNALNFGGALAIGLAMAAVWEPCMTAYLQKHRNHLLLFLAGLLGALLSWHLQWPTGLAAATAFRASLLEMLGILPAVFILIGLGDAWIPKELVARYTGSDSGWSSSLWMILLAMVQGGPLFASFPVAYLMWKKGTSPRNIFVYLGAFSTVKLPMLGMEISFLGAKFTLLRSLFSVPVFLLIAWILDRWFGKDFTMHEGK